MFYADIDTKACDVAVSALPNTTFSACALDSGGSGAIVFAATSSEVNVYTFDPSTDTLPLDLGSRSAAVTHTMPAGQTNMVTGVTGDVASGTFFIFTAGSADVGGTLTAQPALTRLVSSAGTLSTPLAALTTVDDAYMLNMALDPITGRPSQSYPLDFGARCDFYQG